MTWYNAFMILIVVCQIVGAAMLVVAFLWFVKQFFSGINLDRDEETFFNYFKKKDE